MLSRPRIAGRPLPQPDTILVLYESSWVEPWHSQAMLKVPTVSDGADPSPTPFMFSSERGSNVQGRLCAQAA
eukprot:8071713-Pyramimonas_sp.AAC.1